MIHKRFQIACLLLILAATPSLAQDSDGDGVLDVSDNCINVPNAVQVDTDIDFTGEVCDCSPSEDFTVSRIGPAHSLLFTTKTDFQWVAPLDTGGSSLVFDIVRSGDAADFGSATCIGSNQAGTSAQDVSMPASIFFYAIRAQGDCGGNLGAGSTEQRRSGQTCPAGTALPLCVELFDLSCPNLAPACGANFSGGSGCLREFLAFCYDSGTFSYKVTVATPLEIMLDDDMNSLAVFFAHEGTGSGTMHFFDSDNLEVDSPLQSNGNCLAAMPIRQSVVFSRPVRRIRVTSVGGTAWVDTFGVNQ